MKETTHRIPAPPGKPLFHEYAAGTPGDMRPIAVRLAERIMAEDLDITEKDNPALQVTFREALARAFRAGQAFQKENG